MNKNSYFYKIVCFICFITNVGQMPMLIDNFPTRNIIIPLWIFLAFICIKKNFILYVGEAKSLFFLSYIFLVYYILGAIFIDKYLASNLPYVIFLAIFILFIGLLVGRNLKIEEIEKIYTSVILSGIIVGIDVFRKYIYGVSLASRVYTYDSKNSVSQILLTALILIIFLKFKNKKFYIKFFYFISSIILLITLMGLKSRATLVAIPLFIIWLLINGRLNRKLRNIILIILSLIVIILLFNSRVLDILIKDILMAGREMNNLNDISSGRMEEWISFFDDFKNAIFFGHGRMKRESLLLTSLLEFGIIGGSIIILIASWPIYWIIRYLKKTDKNYLIFSSIVIVYFFNSFFEQLAPFGPGVKCFFLWFIMGVLISNKNFYKKRIRRC